MTLACSKDLDPEAGKVHRSDVISFTASLQADATAAPKVARSATSSYLGIAEEEWSLELRESSRPTRGLPVTELEGMDVGVYAYEYSGDTKVADVMSNYYYSFDNNEARINYLNGLLDAFREYMITNNLFDSNYDPFFLYRYNDGNIFAGNSITELYYKFKLFVTGYSNL